MNSIRNVFLLFLFHLCLAPAIAQTDYYYSKGNKNYLTQNTDKVCLSYSKKDTESSEKIKANAQILCTIYDDSFNIFVISQSDIEKLKAQNFWAETGKSVILTSCYYTENNDEVVVSPYLDVRLKKEEDKDLLESYAEKYGLQIVKNDLFMPLWYILAVTPETEKSPLECANELYESGSFAAAVPDFCSLTELLGINGTQSADAQSCPDNNHPHAIDLGLPSGTKWACCNLGATTPEGYGNYYAWGETEQKEKYNWTTYIHCDGSENTCHDLGSDIAGTKYDVAHVKWGGSWVMPSKIQIQELINGCSYTWQTKNNVDGALFTGPNGATVFLPQADIRWNESLECFVSGGYYWSSTKNTFYNSYHLSFDSWNATSGGSDYCGMGLTVRPVITSGSDNIVLLKSDINEGGVPSRIFDMQGRALKETLMKGIYIQNGRKQVLKTVFPHN